MTAVDFAAAAVEPLAAAAARRGSPPAVGDMRDLSAVLPDRAGFDGAWCMGNSFGYLDPAGTARFLAGVAAALAGPAPGSSSTPPRWPRSLLPHLELGDGDERHAVGDVALTNRHHYDAATSTLVTDMMLERR